MKRFIEFDVLRGVLLLMMVVDHSPSSLRLFTDQPFGFFTTAECFVFVSAFLAGMIFRKRARKAGVRSGSIVFYKSSRAHLSGTSLHRWVRICSWQSFLNRPSWY